MCDRLKLSATDKVMSDDAIDDGGGEAAPEFARGRAAAAPPSRATVPIDSKEMELRPCTGVALLLQHVPLPMPLSLY